MAKNKVKIEGIDKVNKEFQKRVKNLERVTPKSAQDVGNDLLNRSARRAPKDTGDLRGSGKTELEGNNVTVSYGTEYALRQHEELDYRHTDGEAKYLENPYKENKEKYIKHFADSTKRGLE